MDGNEIFDISAQDVTSASIVIYNGTPYALDGVVYYLIEDGKISEGDQYDVQPGVTPLVCVTTDTPDDYILAYIFIVVGGRQIH